MIASPSNLLGLGIYTPSEAALYARVRTQLMNRWIYGNATGEPVVRAQIGTVDDQRVVSFLDLVQTLAIRSIRVQFNIPLTKIREAYETARNEYGVDYPFAVSHKTSLFGNISEPASCEVVIELPGHGESNRFVQLTGKRKKNQVIRQVLETHHHDLAFRSDGLAASYRAFFDGSSSIVMNPEISFGEPVVGETGYTAQTLYESFKSEGSVQAAAHVYGVSEADIEIACKYFDFLTGSNAT